MKKLMSFAVIALLCAACNNNSSEVKMEEAPERNGWAGPDLYGKVKSVTVKEFRLLQNFDEEIIGDMNKHEIYHFDSSNGNVIEHIKFDADGKITDKSTYSYDSNGNVLESKFYDENDKLFYMWIHAYDSEGNLVEECHRFPDGSLDSKFIYAYDSNGNLIEENRYDFRTDNEETKFVYVYDHRGNVIEENRYDSANGDIDAKVIVDYDSTGAHKGWADYIVLGKVAYFYNGSENKNIKTGTRFVFEDNIVKYPYSDKDLESVNQCDSTGVVYTSGRLMYKRIYSYNSQGQKIEFYKKENNYFYSGSYRNCSIDKFSYLYDPDGNLIEKTLIEGGSIFDETETYVYDSKGNMIEENSYNKDGSLSSKIIHTYDENGREIEYTYYHSNGQPWSKYTYVYDSNGNVIEEKGNFYNSLTQYEIEYYQ